MQSLAATGVAIMGATSVGKSDVALSLAGELGGEIISMDSRHVYRGFDVGTAKLGEDELRGIPHHLIDTIDAHERWSAGAHATRVVACVRDIQERGNGIFLVGGTGLYFRVLFDGLIDVTIPPIERSHIRAELDEKSTEVLHAELQRVDLARSRELSPNDRNRISRALEIVRYTGVPYSAHREKQVSPLAWSGPNIVLTMPRPILRDRIRRRTRAMFDAGWVDEVRALLSAGVDVEAPGMQSLGYRSIARAIQEGRDTTSIFEAIITETQQYAKRQETFFRSFPDALWIDASRKDAAEKAKSHIEKVLGA